MTLNARRFLILMLLQAFAVGLSNIFVNLYIWNIDRSLFTQASYSLSQSAAILLSFPLCSLHARRTSPMASSRVGLVLFMLAYAVILWLQEDCARHVVLIGGMLGLAVSFFVIGQHMQFLENAQDAQRDRFLYAANYMTSGAAILAPLLAGWLIQHIAGAPGYSTVFGLSLLTFAAATWWSTRITGQPLARQSNLLGAWRNKQRTWRGMFWASTAMATVQGTYTSFLVTIMAFSILQDEFALGAYSAMVALVGLVSSVALAARSQARHRLRTYTVGALLVCAASIALALVPTPGMLVVYGIASAIGMNTITTCEIAWSYAAIESAPDYDQHKLDYIVVREIPLGIGRMVGVGVFLLLNSQFESQVLTLGFVLFGAVYLALVPALRRIWQPALPALQKT
ncbi:MAG: MFS transporter [Rhodoferax sp.]|uniref:MFS transporter n=1 Tax=Rhodoferax sp. TaxID=50421 RepID=UPI0032658C63